MLAPTADVPDNDAPQPLRGKRARRAQGYEPSPPRCANCTSFVPPCHGRPAQDGLPKVQYEPARCGLGYFAVHVHGVCDEWTGKDGATLDDRDKIATPAT